MSVALEAAITELVALADASGFEAPGVVRFRREGPVGVIEIDAPASRNALSLRRMAQLGDAVAAALASPDLAVVRVISAVPGVFCAGGHLGEVAQFLAEPARGARMARAMGVITEALRRAPFVSIAEVDGPALGGGAELCTATDVRAMGHAGRIAFVQAPLGVACGWGGAGRLAAIIGPGRAAALLAGGDALGPAAAAAIGLVDRVGDTAAAASAPWVASVVASPGAAVRATKRQVVAALPPVDGDLAAEIFAEVWGGDAHRARLAGR